jgi:hypothetical protein
MTALPDVHVAGKKEPDWRVDGADHTPDDDEQLGETPASVVEILGFDPLEMDDDEIDTSDIPEASEEWFKKAQLREPK